MKRTSRTWWLLTLLVAFATQIPFAQSQNSVKPKERFHISGRIQSTSGMGIPDCSVALWRSQDSVLISASISGRGGDFAFADLPPDDYYLQLAHMGYERRRVDISLHREDLSLPPIVLRELMNTLSEIIVTAKRPLIKMKGGGEIHYAVSADPLAKHSSLYQILQRVPLVSLTSAGIAIKGSIPPTYYINGIPAPQLNQNPLEALKAMRADQIQEIQLITIPGAQYDGDFAGGVINIVMKQHLSSSLTASLGSTINTRNQYGGNGSLSLQLGKVVAQASISYSDQSGYKERWGLDRIAYNDTQRHHFLQEKEREYDRNSAMLSSLNLSWSPNESNLINAYLNYTRLNTRGTGRQTHRMHDQSGTLNYGFLVNERSDTEYETLSFSSSYQRKWGKDATLLLMYQLTDMPKALDDTYLVEQRMNYTGDNQRMKQKTHNKEHTLQSDFSYSLSPVHKLNVGVKHIIRTNSNDSELHRQDLGGAWLVESNPGDRFAHQQRVLGIYGEYQVVKEPWNLRLGLRKEWTREKVSYLLQPRDDFRTSSDDWFLSLLASYELSASSTFSLSYRSNITRPSIRHLSPRSILQDPSYVYYGNPKLRSEKHHTWGSEWSYTKEELLLNLSASYSYSNNSIQADFGVLPEGGMYRTFSNAGRYRDAGLSGYSSYSFSKVVSASLEASTQYRILEGTLAGSLTSSRGWTGSLSSTINLNLPKDYYLSLYGGYNFPHISLEGRGYNFYHCGGSLAKSFLNDRLNLSLTAIDFLWGTKDYHRAYQTPDFYGKSTYQNYGFLLELEVTYRFNTKRISVSKASKKIQNKDVATFGE